MSIEYIRHTYCVPAQKGGRVRYTGDKSGPQLGTIRGASGQYLEIQLDGTNMVLPFHPTWELEYLDKPEKDTPCSSDSGICASAVDGAASPDTSSQLMTRPATSPSPTPTAPAADAASERSPDAMREALEKAMTWEARLNEAEQALMQGDRARWQKIKLTVQYEMDLARAALASPPANCPMSNGDFYAVVRMLEVFAPAHPFVTGLQRRLAEVKQQFYGDTPQIGREVAEEVDRIEKMKPSTPPAKCGTELEARLVDCLKRFIESLDPKMVRYHDTESLRVVSIDHDGEGCVLCEARRLIKAAGDCTSPAAPQTQKYRVATTMHGNWAVVAPDGRQVFTDPHESQVVRVCDLMNAAGLAARGGGA